ncbi:MAG: ABC transporter substrate-binding protein [Rhizobiales bacterium]|nr:ABC transporter substrate-binding protein [Hyphomicrobiales bacterium]
MFRTRMFLAATTLAYGLSLGTTMAAEPLSVMSFGGAYQEAQRKAVFTAYAEETGRPVSEQEYGGEIAKIKAMIDSGNTTIDVVDVDAPTLLQGCDEGIFETIDWEKIGPKSDWLAGTTSDCGVGTIVYATILSYDEDKLAKPPTKLADLFDLANFPGKRGLKFGPKNTLEAALMADGVPAADVYEVLSAEGGVDRAFKKLDEIKSDIVWWKLGAESIQQLASGETVMATAYNGRVVAANRDENRQFEMAWDAGSIYFLDYFAILSGSEKKEDAEKFIAYAIGAEGQRECPSHIGYGPTNLAAFEGMDAKVSAELPTEERLASSVFRDDKYWLDHNDELTQRFNVWAAQ